MILLSVSTQIRTMAVEIETFSNKFLKRQDKYENINKRICWLQKKPNVKLHVLYCRFGKKTIKSSQTDLLEKSFNVAYYDFSMLFQKYIISVLNLKKNEMIQI